MQFTLPTTKEQMYETLGEIFYYYRIKREGWEGVELLPLTLNRIEFTPLSENDIKQRIDKYIAPEISMQKRQEMQAVEKEISSLQTQKINLSVANEEQKLLISKEYELQSSVLMQDALSRGTAQSTIITKALEELQSDKAEKIEELSQSYATKISEIDGRITALNQKLTDIENFYSAYRDQLFNSKLQQGIDEQEKFGIDVLKYNNGIEEREVKHANSVLSRSAELELKFRELNQEFYTKDQLVEMGYYEDVIACVCAYYDTLDALTAYQQFSADKKVPIYLDDYYINILYIYRSRAGQ
ncbi:MAG: hypothetical protein IKB98_10415 [Clostridia bacterium]|nr:hypothetical protein [Clostridia bacterium]